MIEECWSNGTFTLQCGAIKLGIIYVALNHIHLIQTLKILNVKNMYGNSQHMITSYVLLYLINDGKKSI